jgi:uncharacterized membrane protein HdeD (DUF308 family)
MTNGRSTDHILLTTLGQNWWMVGARGLLACLFGLAVLLRPGLSLNLLVATFGVYAVLDGAWAVASALWVSRISFAMWPVLFEGAVSLGVGWLALGWPLVPRDAVRAIAAWGLLTGVLELVAAARLPRRSAGSWLLLTAACSPLPGRAHPLLPHAVEPSVARAVVSPSSSACCSWRPPSRSGVFRAR